MQGEMDVWVLLNGSVSAPVCNSTHRFPRARCRASLPFTSMMGGTRDSKSMDGACGEKLSVCGTLSSRSRSSLSGKVTTSGIGKNRGIP